MLMKGLSISTKKPDLNAAVFCTDKCEDCEEEQGSLKAEIMKFVPRYIK